MVGQDVSSSQAATGVDIKQHISASSHKQRTRGKQVDSNAARKPSNEAATKTAGKQALSGKGYAAVEKGGHHQSLQEQRSRWSQPLAFIQPRVKWERKSQSQQTGQHSSCRDYKPLRTHQARSNSAPIPSSLPATQGVKYTPVPSWGLHTRPGRPCRSRHKKRARNRIFWGIKGHVSCVMCHVSPVTCHL